MRKRRGKTNGTAVMNKLVSLLPYEYNSLSTAWEATTKSEKTMQELIVCLLKEEEKLNNLKPNQILRMLP